MEENVRLSRNKLRQMRELRGWTQKDLADKLSLPDTRTLRRWESGGAIPSLRYRARLCDIFEMGPAELGLISESQQPMATRKAPASSLHTSPGSSLPGSSSKLQLPVPLGPSSLSSQQWNRQQLLKKVHAFWIKEVLEPSLHGGEHLKIELQELPAAVANPWKQIVEPLQRSLRPLPPGASLIQLYDQAYGELLILGGPGAGKTTLLLELACELLRRAGENGQHPMPVVFNLLSWSVERMPLAIWLVEELNSKYQVPRQVGQTWVENAQILPLLDGLDEVNPVYRQGCVEAINAYRQTCGFLPTVVCSRKDDYLCLTTHLLLQTALCIQPLTPPQIDKYLTKENGQLAALRLALREDEELQHLVTTPLLLDVLTLASQGQSSETSKDPGFMEAQRKHLLATYVEYMLKRPRGGKCYPTQQSIRWLSYLARQMKRHGQTDFSPDLTQLAWQPGRHLLQIVSRVFVGLWTGLVSGVLIEVIAQSLWQRALVSAVITPGIILVIGVLVGITGSLLEAVLSGLLKKVCVGVLAPWKSLCFLEYATEHILLDKKGEEYRFVHPLLLDYFASL